MKRKGKPTIMEIYYLGLRPGQYRTMESETEKTMQHYMENTIRV